MNYAKILMKLWQKEMYIINDEDFADFCRVKYQQLLVACELVDIQNDEDFEDFVEKNYQNLYRDYINSMDRTIH